MTKKQILLSSITTLALLLGGCKEGGENPVVVDPVNPPVVVNPDPTEPTEPQPVVNPYKSAGWYGKTEVSATASDGSVYSHSTAGVFGELLQSNEAKDQHDIPGYGSSIIRVVFPQTEWLDDNGDYFSDYKKYDENSTEKRVWTFQVKNQETVNLATASITIHLDGVFDVQYKEVNGKVTYKESTEVNQTIVNELHLVDVDTATEYTVDQLKTANLTMEGLHTRTFRWVLGVVEQDDYSPLTTIKSISSFSTEDEVDAFSTKTSTQNTGGKFGLPPQ